MPTAGKSVKMQNAGDENKLLPFLFGVLQKQTCMVYNPVNSYCNVQALWKRYSAKNYCRNYKIQQLQIGKRWFLSKSLRREMEALLLFFAGSSVCIDMCLCLLRK